MNKTQAQVLIDLMNAVWLRADGNRNNMTEEEARLSYIVPDMIRSAGFMVTTEVQDDNSDKLVVWG